MRAREPLQQSLLSDKLPAWFSHSGPQSDLVISTRVRLARNLAGHRFTYHAGRSERKQVFDIVAAVLGQQKEFRSFTLVNCASLTQLDRELLLEERLVSPDLLDVEGDRGVAISSSRHMSIMINEEDHLRLHAIDSGFTAEEIWQRINLLDDLLGHYLPFAYEPRRGFLTSCPTNSGTGLRVSFLLHLPGLTLTKTIDPVLLGASQMGISARGFFGEHSEVVGNLFQLSNQATLGACEEEFLQHTHKIIGEVLTHERSARERIITDAALEITDKVYRAWGILLHAKMLTMNEFLNLSSALRLGIDCGIFRETDVEQLNRTTIAVMPAHLQRYRRKKMTEELLQCERADLVRELLNSAPQKRTTRKPKSTLSTDNNEE